MGNYERLSVLDRAFIDLEGHDTHMHIASVLIFDAAPLATEDGGIDVGRIRRYIESRLHLIPRYRQRLAFVPFERHPVWVDDDRLNLRYHVRHASLPKPGDARQLKRLAGRIMSQQLDRGKPLWELWVVEGLEDGRCALVVKTHHCMIDGISGVDLMAVLLSSDAQEEFGSPPSWNPSRPPGPVELLRDEALRRVWLPWTIGGALLERLFNPARAVREARDLVSGVSQAAASLLQRSDDTPLNRPVGAYRRFDWTSMKLSDVKAVKDDLGGTVNDVILATVAGAVRRFLELRGVSPEEQERTKFRVFCPVSTRAEEDRGTFGNQVSGMVIDLPIGLDDPKLRLGAITDETRAAKDENQALGAEALTAISEWTTPTLLGLGARLSSRVRTYNLVVTNVPGPQVPLYLLGARLEEAFPLVPLFSNQALGIALFSYDGRLDWGFNADWDLVPDLHRFVEAIEESFAELSDAGGDLDELLRKARGPVRPKSG